jgi:hypothetical protein
MIIFSQLPAWTSSDAQNLRELLENKTLRSAFMHVYAMRPSLKLKGPPDERLCAADVAAGYEDFLENLMSLTTEEPAAKQSVSAYPALEDDSQWPAPPPIPSLPQSPGEASIEAQQVEQPTTE